MKYLDPKNDITFKKVFGQHPDILISFLNALLPLPEDQLVVEIEYLNNELLPDLPHLKNSIVNIRCRDKGGRHFLVEMQMLWTENFESRTLYNAAKVFAKQISKGQQFDLLAPVYSLNIVNEAFSKQDTVWFHHFRLSHQTITERFIEGMEFVLVELTNFIPATMQTRRLTALWLRFLKEIENHTSMIPAELMEVPEIAQAVEVLKETSYSREELEQYEKYWDVVRTQKAFVQDALKKGKLEGKLEGKVEGKLEGKVEGKLEGKVEIATTLKLKGFSAEEIQDITGLPGDLIAQL